VLAWLGHPVTMAALALLVVNDTSSNTFIRAGRPGNSATRPACYSLRLCSRP
jgi:hypothetical protein